MSCAPEVFAHWSEVRALSCEEVPCPPAILREARGECSGLGFRWAAKVHVSTWEPVALGRVGAGQEILEQPSCTGTHAFVWRSAIEQ